MSAYLIDEYVSDRARARECVGVGARGCVGMSIVRVCMRVHSSERLREQASKRTDCAMVQKREYMLKNL